MVRWKPIIPGWQDDLLAAMPPGVDRAQIDANLRLTPGERIEKMVRLQRQLEAMRAHDDRPADSDRDPQRP